MWRRTRKLMEDRLAEYLSGNNYFLYLLAILDKRTGRRTIKNLQEH